VERKDLPIWTKFGKTQCSQCWGFEVGAACENLASGDRMDEKFG